MKYQTEMPDEKLIQFYLSNNPMALATLTDLYKDRIYSVIYSTVKDRYAAELIFKEVFVRIINNMMIGKNPEEMTFLQWASDVAQQLCLEYNYKVRQAAVHSEICRNTVLPEEMYEALPDKTFYDNHIRLRNVIHMLPDGQREVLILNHYAGVSFRNIAAKMKCSVTTTLDTMNMALGNLRKLMTENNVALG